MTLLSLLGRIMRYFLLRPETLFLLCISLALWSYFFHTDEVKTIVKSSRDAVKMVKGKVAEIMQNDRLGGLDVLDAEFSKTWEFKSHNVAVYSIQGRRDHMEDRFEVITDLVNKTHPSIFGIFDGHGGEASAQLGKKRDVGGGGLQGKGHGHVLACEVSGFISRHCLGGCAFLLQWWCVEEDALNTEGDTPFAFSFITTSTISMV